MVLAVLKVPFPVKTSILFFFIKKAMPFDILPAISLARFTATAPSRPSSFTLIPKDLRSATS